MTIRLKLAILASVLLFLSVVTAVSYTSYKYGYNSASLEYISENIKRTNALVEQVNSINESLSGISKSVSLTEEQRALELKEILKRLRASSVTVIRDNKCEPSASYLQAIDDALAKAGANK